VPRPTDLAITSPFLAIVLNLLRRSDEVFMMAPS
jgi:hypothetical protein